MADPRPPESSLDPELRARRYVQGAKPGSRYVQILRPFADEFRQSRRGHLVATEQVLEPAGSFGRLLDALRRTFVGSRIPSEREGEERVGVLKGLAIFASDNISSSAYATEEIMRVVALAGAGALALTMPLTVGIVVVLAIVVISYQQTISAYPSGGGSYIVASENLGRAARARRGRRAAHRLRPDRRGLGRGRRGGADLDLPGDSSTSAFCMGVVLIGLLWIGNLRGVRESGTLFALPTYLYLVAIIGPAGLRPVAHVTRHAARLPGRRPAGRSPMEPSPSASSSSCGRSPPARWR